MTKVTKVYAHCKRSHKVFRIFFVSFVVKNSSILKKMKKTTLLLFLATQITFVTAQKVAFVQVKTQNLYEVTTPERDDDINGFTDLVIFGDDLDNSVWASPEKQCVTLQKETVQTHSGKGALHVKWDKVTGGCKWIGIGFGWNNWQPKDMTDVADAAIQLQVRAVKGSFSNLPVAFAIEDYSGVQSYYPTMEEN